MQQQQSKLTPHHNLMMPAPPAGNSLQNPPHVERGGDGGIPPQQDPLLQRDFVSQRYRSFHPVQQSQEQSSSNPQVTGEGEGNQLWLGVSDMERLLISCCKNASDEPSSGEQPQVHTIPGTLDRNLVLRFMNILAFHCHDLGSRALALAILERSLEQDELEEAAADERSLESEHLFGSPCTTDSNDIEDISSTEPDAKRARLKEEGQNDEKEPLSVVRTSGRRILDFLSVGGMRILQQWLIEASTPIEQLVSSAYSKPPASLAAASARPRQQTTTRPSPTGPLLLILLQFLSSIPFDKQLITKSKINKQIRTLSKQMDSLAADPNVVDTTTHVASGGLSIKDVKEAIDRLKQVWEEKAKKSAGASSKKQAAFLNPLDQLQQRLMEQLEIYQKYSSSEAQEDEGMDDKPEWLIKVEEMQKAKEKKRASKSSRLSSTMSTADLARKERENEKAALMREDLLKAQEQRRQLVIKLRELKQKSQQEEEQARKSSNKRSIRWKDGEGPASRVKNRDLLEEVFLIPSGKSRRRGKGDDFGSSELEEDLDAEEESDML